MAKAPGVKDVAAHANVSAATVSRFLNGTLELPEQTSDRITNAIKALNYQPNPYARRLSLGRSDTIGLVVPEIANPFFATFVAAVEEIADQKKLTVSLHATLNRSGREIEYLKMLGRKHLDGLIFVTNHRDHYGELAALINETQKVVVVDEDVPDANVPKLFGDNEQGGYLAGRHLLERRHRRILFVGGPEGMLSTSRRFSGLQRAMAENALEGQHLTAYYGDYTVEAGRRAALRFLDSGRPATAIFASSDEVAIGMLEVFRSRGISIPDDVSLIGFDDVGPLHLFEPALTAIRQPVAALGKRALSILLDTDWQERTPSVDETLLPVELIERESVASPKE